MAGKKDTVIIPSETEIPDTALMTPIDIAAPKIQDIEAVPLEGPPQPMGAGTETIYGPGGQPELSGMMSEGGVMGAVQNPFSMDTWTNLSNNATGQAYPIDLTTNQPFPEQPVIPVDSTPEAAILPASVPVVQKTGENRVETVNATEGTNAALEGARQAVLEIDAKAAQQAQLAEQLSSLKGENDQARLTEADKFAHRAEELYQISQQEADQSRAEVRRLRDQYASMSWDTYWGNKGVGDKIMLGLAVGLGALSQSQIGGQNLAMTLIQSNIEDHTRAQTAKFRNMEAELTNAQNYSIQAQQAIKGQYANLAAQNAAAYDQLDKQLAAISARTNTEKARTDAERMRHELRLKNDKQLFDMEKELNGRSTVTQDVFKTSGSPVKDPTRFITFEGKPMNEQQSKNYSFLLQGAPAVKTMEELENQGITNTDQYAISRRALMNEGRAGLLQGTIDAASAVLMIDNAIARYTAGNVALQNYFRNARIATGQKLRLESGSAIAPSEYLGEILKYTPGDITQNKSPETQASDLDTARQARRNFLMGFRGAAQSPNALWFEGGK